MGVKFNPKYARHFQKWHWGIPLGGTLTWNDPLFPDHMIEIGRLVEVWIRPPDAPKDMKVVLDEAATRKNHVVFDPEHKKHRIYFLLSPDVRDALKRQFWDPKNARPLQQLAALSEGHHARMKDYPRLLVTPLGVCTHVVYSTKKNGDDVKLVGGKVVGPGSNYIHEMGEEGGVAPYIGIDAQGRLWFAGGSYTCPTPGITH